MEFSTLKLGFESQHWKQEGDTAHGAIKVCVVQRPEHSAVNRKVTGSIPVANGLEGGEAAQGAFLTTGYS